MQPEYKYLFSRLVFHNIFKMHLKPTTDTSWILALQNIKRSKEKLIITMYTIATHAIRFYVKYVYIMSKYLIKYIISEKMQYFKSFNKWM